MNRSDKEALKKILKLSDDKSVEDVVAYSSSLGQPDSNPEANLIAIAWSYSQSIKELLDTYKEPIDLGMDDPQRNILELKKIYLKLVNEVESIYEASESLKNLPSMPIWKRFDELESVDESEVNDYFRISTNDHGDKHHNLLYKLFLMKDEPLASYTEKQKEILIEADKLIIEDNEMRKLIEDRKVKQRNNSPLDEYWLTYSLNGDIIINSVHKLKRAHSGSLTEHLLEQAIKQPYVLFKPTLRNTSRNVTTILSGAGFDKTLRALFFPIASNSRGIKFRPNVDRETIWNEKIDTTELDKKIRIAKKID